MTKSKQIPTEVYSRVSGYFRPVFTNGRTGQWNPGKTEEHKERTPYSIPSLQSLQQT